MNTDPAAIATPHPLPLEPRCALSIRQATASDLPFIDRLQKAHTHMAGFFPRQQIQKYLDAGEVLVAETGHSSLVTRESCYGHVSVQVTSNESRATPSPLGYIIARDNYSGRDDVGIVYQLVVDPLTQRRLVGASLVRAAFEKAAYGCRLFCCWCAQDIAANFFWESVGFVPVAFRTGTRSKQRTHIFWQCRTRAGDTTTPWWYPHQTRSGAFREDRLVFPIPPHIHWRDPMPVVMPEPEKDEVGRMRDEEKKGALPSGSSFSPPPSSLAPPRQKPSIARSVAVVRSQSKALQGVPPGKAAIITGGRIRYLDRADADTATQRGWPEGPGVATPSPPGRGWPEGPGVATPSPPGRGWPEGPGEGSAPAPAKKPRKPRAAVAKHDPRHVALARELRDRWLEQVSRDPALLQPAPRYALARPELPQHARPIPQKQLPAAA
jgi:ribosomal protein S18 acetylase RimI-like enzyme